MMGTKRNQSGWTPNEVQLLVPRCDPVSGAHNPKDRFEILCHVAADISSPCTRTIGASGQICYSQQFDVVLLVGLTELKAQIRWSDSTTVRIEE